MLKIRRIFILTVGRKDISNEKSFFFQLDTNLRKDNSLARPFGDDPFALDGFGDRNYSLVFQISSDDYVVSSCCTTVSYWHWR